MEISKKLYFFITFLFCITSINAQQPFSTKWKSIKTPETKIIYPQEIEKDAYRVAQTMRSVFEADTVTLNEKPRRVPLLLTNLPTVSNGYSTLFPYQMLWYPLPFEDCNEIGLSEWFQALSVHEYRHIVQYQATNHYFTKLGSIFFGAYGRAALRYSIPDWWYEGDAVYAETVLSSGGRGRIAKFDMPFAAILNQNNKIYKYDKMLFRSFRDYIPNHYPLGYLLVTRARREYGHDVWQKTAKRSSAYSFWPWAFTAAFKHYSDISLAKNYTLTMNELRNFYNERIENLSITPAKIINDTTKKCYTSYNSATFYNNDTIIAIKTSLNAPDCFVLIDKNGNEKKLFDTDAQSFDCQNNILVWATTIPDMRWTLKGFSDIATYDFKTKKKYNLTKNQRYFSPAVSQDGKFLSTVEFNEKRECKLLIFKILRNKNRKLYLEKIRTFEAQYSEYIRSLVWIGDYSVAYVSNYENKNAIVKINVINGKKEALLPYGHEVVNTLEMSGNNLIYESEHSGIPAIWQIDTISDKSCMIVSRKFGAFAPAVSPDDKTLIFSDYTQNGYNIAAVEISNLEPIKEDNVTPNRLDYFSPLLKYEPQLKVDTVAVTIPDTSQFENKKYRFFYDPIRIYGWLPNVSDGTLSATLNSQNTLGTLNVSGGANYYQTDDFWRYFVTATYSGFYPVLSFSANWGNDADNYLVFNKNGTFSEKTFYWNEKIFSSSISLPLNFSRYNINRHLNIAAVFSYYNINNKITDNYDDLGNGGFSTISASIGFSNYKTTAYRDFNYRLGFSVNFNAKTSVNSHREAKETDFIINLYLLGLAKQHYFIISGVTINQNKSKDTQKLYLFGNSNATVRGYESVRTQSFNKITADYWLPLCYPDAGIPGLIWCKRIKASIFGDVAQSKIFNQKYNYLSYGGKLIFDINFLRIPNDLSIGAWFASPLKENNYSNETIGLIFTYQM